MGKIDFCVVVEFWRVFFFCNVLCDLDMNKCVLGVGNSAVNFVGVQVIHENLSLVSF